MLVHGWRFDTRSNAADPHLFLDVGGVRKSRRRSTREVNCDRSGYSPPEMLAVITMAPCGGDFGEIPTTAAGSIGRWRA
jgi:hypothetical protein